MFGQDDEEDELVAPLCSGESFGTEKLVGALIFHPPTGEKASAA